MRGKGRFVFAVAGEAHVRQAASAIMFLKRLTRCDILLVQSRCPWSPAHDEIIDVPAPAGMSDHQASIFLKTSLPEIIGADAGTFCYLDSDVVAVSREVDDIFSQHPGPIAFAADHARMDVFSRHAVRCFCAAPPCAHFRDRMAFDFGIRVDNPDWPMWNGGVFVCAPEGAPFMRRWHELVLRIFQQPLWHVRDQGALAAAAWQLGLQDLPVLDARFNLIVDRFKGVSEQRRDGLRPQDYAVRTDYRLQGDCLSSTACFLHFINGGAGKTGWRNWDDVVAHHAQAAPA